MSAMRRRTFLGAAAAAAGAAMWPGWLSRAFGDTSAGGLSGDTGDFGHRARDAQRSGKPLFVIVIPEDDATKWQRGRVFGELINHGTAEQIAPLALCEVVCAKVSDVRKLAPAATGEPLAFLIENGAARAIDPKLPEDDSVRRGSDDWDKMVKTEDAVADKRIAQLAKAIAGAVAPDAGALARRAAAVRDPAEADAIARAGAGLVPLLGKLAAKRLRDHRVPGSYWANASGCGTSVEGDDDSIGVACGMGHVPAKSSRFLYLYARTPSQRRRELTEQEKRGK
jgi:hypothetical protein